MYTQCPDCEIAFKVTADVLKQAAGKVRCGGCGSAFNALEYLSEQMPEHTDEVQPPEAVLELTAERENENQDLPQSISAEQSAALLKTLDDLAGSDIRIEDTGVEWRVLDDEENADGILIEDELFVDPESAAIDELLEDSPTPIDEFLTKTPEVVESAEIFEESANAPAKTPVDEIRFDDNTPLPDDFNLDDESSYASLTSQEPVDDNSDEPGEAEQDPEEEPVEIALGEPDDWNDLLGEVAEENAAPIAAELEELEAIDEPDSEELEALEALEAIDEPDSDELAADDSGNQPLDVDTQFALQAEAMGIDDSGVHDVNGVDEDETVLQFDDEAQVDIDDDISELDYLEPQDEPIIESHGIEAELDALEDEAEEQDVPPLTEAEQSVNLLIDQDLMALAIEDEDGFASTIVMPETEADDLDLGVADDDGENGDSDPALLDDGIPKFETIIMEGEQIRTAQDEEQPARDPITAAELAALHSLKSDAEQQSREPRGTRKRMIGAIAVLVVLLIIQVIHQSREALATIPAFHNTVGPIYRILGRPLQPAWDIRGWRIEATDDSINTAEDGESLIVYSRIGNNSDSPLPYPSISISLTDRFVETIGSQVLDPADFLAADLDPQALLQPGEKFDAEIVIHSPSSNATGYKLDVCYRLVDGRLRCAMDDFK